MKYKVGDTVRIKSREWYEENKNENGAVLLSNGCVFWDNMQDMLGCEFKIVGITEDKYILYGIIFLINDEMIEGLVSDGKSLISTEMIKDIAEVVKTHNLGVSISENEGKLIIEPLKVEEEKDLPVDTPCMCSCSMEGQLAWFVRFYAGKGQTWWDLGKSHNETRKVDWNCIIPWDKFNPGNIEESLKYNIVK